MTKKTNTHVSIQGIANKNQITKLPEQKQVNELQVVFEITNGYYTLGFAEGDIQIPQNERSLNVIPQQEVKEMKILIQIIYAMIFGTSYL